MSLFDDFGVNLSSSSLEEQETAARELQFNLNMLQDIRKKQPRETPCKTFYKLKKSIPLSIFLQVYPFNELVDCGLELNLEDLMELERLYSTFEKGDQQFYIDSFRRLQQMITSIKSNKIPGSYGKGFQPWKEHVSANKEVQNVLHMPEPSQEDIDQIAGQHYLSERISTPPPEQTLGRRVASFFGFGGGRKTTKKMLDKKSKYYKRSKSRSKKMRSRKSKSRSSSKK
jgi:hypothetical protein